LHDDRLVGRQAARINALLDQAAHVVVDERDLLLREQHDQPALVDDRERLE
jgi:hypothetical protein